MADQDDDQRDRVLDRLIALNEATADRALRAVGSQSVTTAGYDQLGALDRLLDVERIVSALGSPQMRRLDSLLAQMDRVSGAADMPPAVRIGPAATVSGTSVHGVMTTAPGPVDSNGPIFMVHGRDHAVLSAAVRTLERSTGREVIVLHEQANSGRTLLEKFEQHAQRASYAVVLLTADDEGGLRGAPSQSRARQNVVLELGFFFGALGRDRVTVLIEPGVEQPSDIHGLVYIEVDPGGAWKHNLGRELAAAGIEFDHTRVP